MDGATTHMVLATAVFVITYAIIIWDKFDRSIVAMAGGCLMVILGIYPQADAYHHIDIDTLVLLISTMIILNVAQRSGMFQYMAIKAAKTAKGDPVRVLILLSLVTGVLSAFLNNVTTILLILPVTLTIAKQLKIDPIPFVIAEVFSSNVAGTATLIGDPPNIMIGSEAGLTFMDFLQNVAVAIVPIMLVVIFLFVLIYRKKLVTTDECKQVLMNIDENESIVDRPLLKKSVVIMLLTVVGFIGGSFIGLEASTVGIIGAILIVSLSGFDSNELLSEVEWKTIIFFVGLFMMVGGVEASGAIKALANGVISVTQGNLTETVILILWVSAIASAFIDNIPLVATFIPLIMEMGQITGMQLGPVWWALSLGACLGGNGTIIGASANVVATDMLAKQGHKITFVQYMKVAFPMMIITVALSMVYLLLFQCK